MTELLWSDENAAKLKFFRFSTTRQIW